MNGYENFMRFGAFWYILKPFLSAAVRPDWALGFGAKISQMQNADSQTVLQWLT
jgi:hypothetical protein